MEQNPNLFLQTAFHIRVASLFHSRKRENERIYAHLQLRPQARKYPPEDLHANLEYLRHRADRVPTERQTQVLVRHLDERDRVSRAAGIDHRVWVDEDVHVGVEDDEDHV